MQEEFTGSMWKPWGSKSASLSGAWTRKKEIAWQPRRKGGEKKSNSKQNIAQKWILGANLTKGNFSTLPFIIKYVNKKVNDNKNSINSKMIK